MRKAFGRLGIVLVGIGMKLLGELAISLFDVGFGRVTRDAKG